MLPEDTLRVIDSNVLVRFLVNDSPLKSVKIKRMLSARTKKFLLTDVTVAEVVWVLSSYYKFPKKQIVGKILSLLDLPCLEVNSSLLTTALLTYSQNSIDYVDAYLAAYCLDKGFAGVVSYDRDLSKVAGVRRFEPAA